MRTVCSAFSSQVLGGVEALASQDAGHDFGVREIHLAAVALDVELAAAARAGSGAHAHVGGQGSGFGHGGFIEKI
jgi:hypothetical protein